MQDEIREETMRGRVLLRAWPRRSTASCGRFVLFLPAAPDSCDLKRAHCVISTFFPEFLCTQIFESLCFGKRCGGMRESFCHVFLSFCCGTSWRQKFSCSCWGQKMHCQHLPLNPHSQKLQEPAIQIFSPIYLFVQQALVQLGILQQMKRKRKLKFCGLSRVGPEPIFFGSVARLGSVDHSKRGMRPECKSHREQLQASCFCRRAVCFNCGCTVAGMAESCLASVFFSSENLGLREKSSLAKDGTRKLHLRPSGCQT